MDYKVTLSYPRLWSRKAASRGINTQILCYQYVAGQQQFILSLAEDNEADAQLQLSQSSQRVSLGVEVQSPREEQVTWNETRNKAKYVKKSVFLRYIFMAFY